MSVAFTREESAETAAEVTLPDRPISQYPNLVTASGLRTLEDALVAARSAYEAAQNRGRQRTSAGGRACGPGHKVFL
jgi:hypothetical protein